MAYSAAGLIEASDYNGFVGSDPSATANKINTVWAVGNGNAGYGQTALTQVSGAGLVTANQWSTLISTLNKIRTHQTGSDSGISSSITAGNQINYLSTLSTQITNGYSSRTSFNTQGTTTAGTATNTNFTNANTPSALTFSVSRTATFASADAVRYFFNAGGQLNFVCGTATNNDSTSRSGDLVTLVNTNFISVTNFRSGSNGTRTGTGGTATSTYASGYYGLTTSDQTIVQITSTTSGYTGDYIQLAVRANGVQGSNADVGTVITFTLTLYSGARTTIPAPPPAGPGGVPPTNNTSVNDSVNITVPNRIDIIYPETTNLPTASWGTVTIG